MNIDKNSDILVTCARAMTPLLEKEISALGFPVISSHATGLVTTGSLRDTYRLNLELRTAFNVLYLIKAFRCVSPADLYNKVYQIEWDNIIPRDEYVSVVSRVSNPKIKNSMFASQKLKDAFVDRMMKLTGSRPDTGPDRGGMVLNLYWKDDKAWLYINTSGTKLSDRGYRKIPLQAPMQETLAAAVLMAAGYNGSMNLVNPMCGSGTLAIEAALIALGKAPGLLRSNFGFMHIKGHDDLYWQDLRKSTLKKSAKNIPRKITATDIREKAVKASVKNAMTAGVDHLIEFASCDFRDTPVLAGKSIILLNPEYGERMGKVKDLQRTYSEIGDFFKRQSTGNTGYIFTGNPDLSKKVGLRTSERVPFFNGSIECRLLKYDIY
jgi:putative N6-adenine-specific DNA methylase